MTNHYISIYLYEPFSKAADACRSLITLKNIS